MIWPFHLAAFNILPLFCVFSISIKICCRLVSFLILYFWRSVGILVKCFFGKISQDFIIYLFHYIHYLWQWYGIILLCPCLIFNEYAQSLQCSFCIYFWNLSLSFTETLQNTKHSQIPPIQNIPIIYSL